MCGLCTEAPVVSKLKSFSELMQVFEIITKQTFFNINRIGYRTHFIYVHCELKLLEEF